MAQQLVAVQAPGEGGVYPALQPELVTERHLSFEEASKGLHLLGKDETGSRYAYLMMTVNSLRLTHIKVILSFRHVLFINLNDNYLTLDNLQVLTEMPFLVLLKVERNRLESCALAPMYFLQNLDCNQNQIKDTRDILQPLMETLSLSFNDIYETDWNGSELRNLRQLELRSNLLYEVSGKYPDNLEKLYLPANKISQISGDDLGRLKNLQILHLRDNCLENLNGFSDKLLNLEYLNLRNNKIAMLGEFLKLQCLPKLKTLIVIGNPVFPPMEVPGASGEGAGGEGGEGPPEPVDPAKFPLLALMPNLKRINKTIITEADKMQAQEMEEEILEKIAQEEEKGTRGSNLNL